MSDITKPVLLDETGQNLLTKMDTLNGEISRQNLLISKLVASSEADSVTTLNEIHEIVRSGEAPNVFSIGDQINVNYNDGTNNYVLPFDIVHFGDVELQDGETVPGMFIQSHYAMEGVQFSQNNAFYVAPSGGLTPGNYYFTIGTNWGSHCVSGKSYTFALTESYAEGDLLQLGTATSEIGALPDTAPSNWRVRTYKASGSTPASMAATPTEIVSLSEGTTGTNLGTLSSSTKYGTTGINNLQRSAYGYNRWSQSAMRQRLNSAAAAGAWWSAKNPYDRRPNELATLRGFMAGFDDAFLNIIQPVKVRTALNTLTDSDIGTYEDTYDTFFPASLEQEYIDPQLNNTEGTYWEYWKRRTGATSPQAQGGTYPTRIRYAYNSRSSAQYCRLRSAYRGYACNTWRVGAFGLVVNYSATVSTRCAPACVIC